MNEGSGISVTALFAEVLVVGIGATLASAGFMFCALDEHVISRVLQADTGFLLACGLTLSYAVGIVLDRAADLLLKPLSDKYKHDHFPNPRDYAIAREHISTVPYFLARTEYARSRMRVCRGWVVNGALLTLAVDGNLMRHGDKLNVATLMTVVTILGIALTAGSFFSWKSIVKSSYQQIKLQSDIISARVAPLASPSN